MIIRPYQNAQFLKARLSRYVLSQDKAIEKLTDHEKRMVQLFETNELKTKTEWNSFYRVMQKINTFLDVKKSTSHDHYHKTIYDLLPGYSEEEVDVVIESLSTEDKELIRLRWGFDVKNPVFLYLFCNFFPLLFGILLFSR